MLSDVIRTALEREVVGQPRAIQTAVRGVIRAVSGLPGGEGPLFSALFMGPSGTGKTHLVHTLCRTLHGDERLLLVADCTNSSRENPWAAFASQLAPLFVAPRPGPGAPRYETHPLAIILIEYLERGRPEIVKSLATALESGVLPLPGGGHGSLRRCLIFLTSALCAREILDEGPRIGFSGSSEEEENERARLFRLCRAAAQKQYGMDLVSRLDDLVVFHRLGEEQLAAILERLLAGLNGWLQRRSPGVRCDLSETARGFLQERGRRNLQMGARELLRAFRKYVEFPIADLSVSGRVPASGRVLVEHRPPEGHLHFSVLPVTGTPAPGTTREVRIEWNEEEAARPAGVS